MFTNGRLQIHLGYRDQVYKETQATLNNSLTIIKETI